MSLFIIHSSADENLIKNICKQTSDYQYCTNLYFSDNRSYRVGVHGLALIAIQATIHKAQDTIYNRFPELTKKITDPVGKQSLGVCKTDYTNSVNNFNGAFQSTSKSDYWKAVDSIRKGANDVIDCQDIYKRKNPLADSLISAVNNEISLKLSGIILICINNLLRRS
ncbi:hypothetical protein Dsin_025655 [Dipteronia sinensis]|uniref:Pectinesterase inhibitor domain-containing protein n=1 Tax=Dipteronia sinensis TaxID=43782 RepID=A0AAD9ZW29_9ROSI|nr:hypothetical protein Dsin_025655 [Dipteronia sinensis]